MHNPRLSGGIAALAGDPSRNVQRAEDHRRDALPGVDRIAD